MEIFILCFLAIGLFVAGYLIGRHDERLKYLDSDDVEKIAKEKKKILDKYSKYFE